MRWIAVSITSLAFLIVIAAVTVYLAPSDTNILLDRAELEKFGTYFGGVAGPLLSLVAFLGVVLTLRLQNQQIEHLEEGRRIEQHIRALTELFADLQALEQQSYSAGKKLADALNDPSIATPSPTLSILVKQYIEVLGMFAQQVCLYRSNIPSSWWDSKAFALRGKRLLVRVRPLGVHAGQMVQPTFTFIEMLLNGETEKP